LTFCRYHSKIRPIPSNEETLDMAMIGTLVWGCRKTGATITGCTYDWAERQVKDRIGTHARRGRELVVRSPGFRCRDDERSTCREKYLPTQTDSGSLGGRMNSIAIGMEFRPVMDDVRGELSRVTHDRAKRQVMDRIVETGGRCCLVADSRIGCSHQKVAPPGMPFGDRRMAARYAPVLDFRIDLLSPGRHGEIGFGNGKGGGGRKLGLKLRHAGSCEKAWLADVGTGTVAGLRGGRIDETGNGKFRNESRWHQKVAHIRRQLRFYWKMREAGHLGSYVCLPTINRRIITFNPEKTSTGFSRYKPPGRSIMTFTCPSNRL